MNNFVKLIILGVISFSLVFYIAKIANKSNEPARDNNLNYEAKKDVDLLVSSSVENKPKETLAYNAEDSKEVISNEEEIDHGVEKHEFSLALSEVEKQTVFDNIASALPNLSSDQELKEKLVSIASEKAVFDKNVVEQIQAVLNASFTDPPVW